MLENSSSQVDHSNVSTGELVLSNATFFGVDPRRKFKKILQPPLAFSFNQNTELASANISENDNDEKKLVKKILQPPLAFSYNGVDKNYEAGGGRESSSGNYQHSKSKEEKTYDDENKANKKETGHYDDTENKGSYNDENGELNNKFHKENYYRDTNKDDDGEINSEFTDDGKHDKGHNTKGEHSVNQKDFFEQVIEFYDNYFDDDDEDSDSAFYEENNHKKGNDEKRSYAKHSDNLNTLSNKGYADKDDYYDKLKDYNKKKGHDVLDGHQEKYRKYTGINSKMNWDYSDDMSTNDDSHMSNSKTFKKEIDALQTHETFMKGFECDYGTPWKKK
ncbi:hypothetical protein FQA39_LY06098 [Lamprigera yunnana]|nr:hypothetical protein FQA39_LY06098 [Lamprigera yunnana]